jgi:hypothetical protein
MRSEQIKRAGAPGDVTEAVLYLAAPESSFIADRTILVNRGRVMYEIHLKSSRIERVRFLVHSAFIPSEHCDQQPELQPEPVALNFETDQWSGIGHHPSVLHQGWGVLLSKAHRYLRPALPAT